MVLMSGRNWSKLQMAKEPGKTVLTDFGSPDEKCVVFPFFFSALLGKRDVMVSQDGTFARQLGNCLLAESGRCIWLPGHADRPALSHLQSQEPRRLGGQECPPDQDAHPPDPPRCRAAGCAPVFILVASLLSMHTDLFSCQVGKTGAFIHFLLRLRDLLCELFLPCCQLFLLFSTGAFFE